MDRVPDLRYHMAGRDQVDIMAAHPFQVQHDPGQTGGIGPLAVKIVSGRDVTDIAVLTEHAVQVAAGEKDRATPLSAHQRGFFPKMGAIAGNQGIRPHAAASGFSGQPVHSAGMRTDLAGGKHVREGFPVFFPVHFRYCTPDL